MPQAIIPTTNAADLRPEVQSQTAQYFAHAMQQAGVQEQSGRAAFDSVKASEALHAESAPDVVASLIQSLPEQVTGIGGRSKDTASIVMDAVASSSIAYKKEHGRHAPDWVFDTAIRQALTIANPEYARQIGLGEYAGKASVFDDVGSVSGGAMKIGQVLVAITQSFAENIPFAGNIALGNGLEGRIFNVGHIAGNDVGAYKQGDKLDGLSGGKSFMQSKRLVDGALDAGKYSGVVKHQVGDADGCPIRPDSIAVHVNGLLVVSSAVSTSRNTTAVSASSDFKLPSSATPYSVTLRCPDVTKGAMEATFTPDLPAGAVVAFAADVDYEHSSMMNANKRPIVSVIADSKSLRAHYISGRYKRTQEAKHQWSADVGLDSSSLASLALRNQSGAERHNMATKLMYQVGRAFQTTFSLNWPTRLDERSMASILGDLTYALSEADTAMIARTQVSSIGVIYVGQGAVPYFDSMPPEVFTPSNIQRRAGVYRLGTFLGRYEVYYSPIEELNVPNTDGFQMLCIGRSNQVGANPFIVGDALGAQLLPQNINDDGEQGSFYFQALGDTVNPWTEFACAAAIINVTKQ
ncbi:hypothetical protein LVJ82_17265 [Vitreoscilla massiliensis]|uniref:Major capsid protein n=1 Tax=Vitreoscilla massiliensis TaxID=1689272 RepID=A0ABY4E099_9NEIS|nr:hypothetical protein [Vitreoscilla massiliensis]UOO89170.1 hypothetical protein LVJ82_17265 [Vitreoscilla massiliensis]